MEITRQLRRERVDKKGLAPIQLTFCWDGQRLRLPSGQNCLPKDLHSQKRPLTVVSGLFVAGLGS